MTSWKALRTLIIGATFLAPVSAVYAETVDFTSNAWSSIGGNSHTVGGITLMTSNPDHNMTFNDPDGATGCGDGGAGETAVAGATGLACFGDGIGIGDDEITQSSDEGLIVKFNNGPVNIHAVHLLDLFPEEKGDGSDRGSGFGNTGEIAVVSWNGGMINVHATGSDPVGGYWEVNLLMAGITEFTLTGFNDDFSDYALARIDYSVVPVPAAFWMFGTALIGFVAMSRRTKV